LDIKLTKKLRFTVRTVLRQCGAPGHFTSKGPLRLPNVNNNTSISFLTFTGMNMGQGEKSEKVLGGSGGMLPRKKILNIPYFNASI